MDNWNTTSNDESLQANTTGDVAAEAKQTKPDEYKAKHDALYGKYTAKAENELALSKKVFNANKEELIGFSDSIKNKIVKEEWGYDTFSEAQSILWENFYKSSDDDGDNNDDDVTKRLAVLEKEKKIADYKAKKSLVTNKVDLYIATHNLGEREGMKNLIEKEMENISDSIDIDQRIENAVALVKFKHWSNKDVNFATTTSWGGSSASSVTGWWEDKGERNPELGALFGNKVK